MDARSVGQARIAQRRFRVNPPAHRLHDVPDHRHELVLGGEVDWRQNDLAVDLDVDVMDAHDHDFTDTGICHQRTDWPELRVIGWPGGGRGRWLDLHWVNRTADGQVRSVGSAMIETPPLPFTVADQAMTPPAIVAR